MDHDDVFPTDGGDVQGDEIVPADIAV